MTEPTPQKPAGKELEPLKPPPYTMFHNYILDHIMRELSPNAWKVLCWAVRQTIGYADETSRTKRKEADVISYGQFMEATGIGGRSTLADAIKECLEKKYLKRVQVGISHGKPIFSYRLNIEYTVLNQDSPTKARVLKQDAQESRNRTSDSPETGHTKETTEKKKDDLVVVATEFGIDEATAKKLARECSAQHITDWIAYANGPKGRGLNDPVGFVVRRLLDGYAPPAKDGRKAEQAQEENRRRYIEGEYADYIEH